LQRGDYDQLHHFIADGVWTQRRCRRADRLVGGDDAVLVIGGAAAPKKGERSVGVAAQ
jgi:hypothetical protein